MLLALVDTVGTVEVTGSATPEAEKLTLLTQLVLLVTMLVT